MIWYAVLVAALFDALPTGNSATQTIVLTRVPPPQKQLILHLTNQDTKGLIGNITHSNKIAQLSSADIAIPDFFFPTSKVIEFPETESPEIIIPLPRAVSASLAVSAIAEYAKIRVAELRISSSFTDSSNNTHIYITRLINGYKVLNNLASAHFVGGELRSCTISFADKLGALPPIPNRSSVKFESDVIDGAQKRFGALRDKQDAFYSYIQTKEGEMVYSYNFQLRNDAIGFWALVSINVNGGGVLQVVNYFKSVSGKYKVIKLPNVDPTKGFETVTDLPNLNASPKGWHEQSESSSVGANKKSGYTTSGNNVEVKTKQNGIRTVTHGHGNKGADFDFHWDPNTEPNSTENSKATSVHLFYLINQIHDILYQYGFTEAAGNFQHSNMGKGGTERDQIFADPLSAEDEDNSNFAAPPDGQHGVMQLYIFTNTIPHRSAALSSVIPIHEFGHGLSSRLSGGPKNALCLESKESSSLGEGWSDALGLFLSRTRDDSSENGIYEAWWLGGSNPHKNGMRNFPYSTSMWTNPLTLSTLNSYTDIHEIGAIWASMLNELYWGLVEDIGFSSDWMDSKQMKGNVVAMQLMIGGMNLQPCNPTFTQARDAILRSDSYTYKGLFECTIWRAFAKRGLGIDSVQDEYKDGFKIPLFCKSQEVTRRKSEFGTLGTNAKNWLLKNFRW